MKLTRTQQQKIENIIKEEMHNLNRGWRLADAAKKRSSAFERSMMNEAVLTPDSVGVALEGHARDVAQKCFSDYDIELMKHVGGVLGMRPQDITDEMEDSGSFEDLVMAQMDLVSDIAAALDTYTQKVVVAVLASQMTGDE